MTAATEDLSDIPPFLRRAPSQPARKFSEEVVTRRRVHKTAVECHRLLERARRKKAREVRKRRKLEKG